MKKLLIVVPLLVIAVLMLLPLAGCGSATTTTGTSAQATTTPAGNKLFSINELSDVAPGLGDVMPALDRRNTILYYAAKGGNWDLAAYQVKELGEGIDVGMITRPARKSALDNFASTALTPLGDAVKSKDMAKFDDAWSKENTACNACHVSQGFKYIVWSLPKTQPESLQLTAAP